ncbi:MAG: hypothetical protein HYR84_00720 [Planctomycetes bacterium]|nr:hypothetical protein [Planctomycetota bacterium]
MIHIAILPVPAEHGGVSYCAISRGKQSHGATAGEALDALTVQLHDDEKGTVVVIQDRRPDQFFTRDQQQRLAELMARWRACRDEGKALSPEEEADLSALVDAELRGAALRADAMADGRTP